MHRLFVLVLVASLGCNRSSPAPAGPGEVASHGSPQPAPAAASQTPTKAPQANAPAPAAPPAFAFPVDAGGSALAKVVTPATPAPLPVERFGEAPAERTPPAAVLFPEPSPPAGYALPPPVLPEKPAGLKPADPPERVPVALGAGAGVLSTRPALPDAPGITARAPDVSRPPALPPLARRVPDRASLDDPTAEPGHTVIVNRPVEFPWGPAAFLKVTVPDPFELAAQVKPGHDPAAEPGLQPVPVKPRRPK
jgi:hypothetical protein